MRVAIAAFALVLVLFVMTMASLELFVGSARAQDGFNWTAREDGKGGVWFVRASSGEFWYCVAQPEPHCQEATTK